MLARAALNSVASGDLKFTPRFKVFLTDPCDTLPPIVGIVVVMQFCLQADKKQKNCTKNIKHGGGKEDEPRKLI